MFKNLSIKVYATLLLSISLVIVFSVMLIINIRDEERSMDELYESNMSELRWAVSQNIEFMMLAGEN